MDFAALGLVLLSAVAHASWNFLAKRGTNHEAFLWWTQSSMAVLLLPVGVIIIWLDPIIGPGWWFALGTVLMHVLYFLFLGKGYARGDLSVVYPIARGAGPGLVPILGVLALSESVSPLAIAGIVVVLAGIYTVYWWGRFSQILSRPLGLLREPGSRYAVLTGLVIAAYSIWDKVGVRYVNPFLYMYLLFLGTSLILSPYMYRSLGWDVMRAEWKLNFATILASGALSFLAYTLVLTALTFSRVSYVAPVREIGIVMGVLLGVLVLKEPFGRGRLLGSSLIVLGVMLIALAP